MENQSEFIDTNNVLKHDLNKMWFHLKETNIYSQSDCFDFKRFQKENITSNKNVSRYEIGLPFKEYHKILSDNYFNCKRHFRLLSKRFEKNNGLLQKHKNITKEELELNFVEKAPLSEINNFNQVGNIPYLQHRPLIKDNRVTLMIV